MYVFVSPYMALGSWFVWESVLVLSRVNKWPVSFRIESDFLVPHFQPRVIESEKNIKFKNCFEKNCFLILCKLLSACQRERKGRGAQQTTNTNLVWAASSARTEKYNGKVCKKKKNLGKGSEKRIRFSYGLLPHQCVCKITHCVWNNTCVTRNQPIHKRHKWVNEYEKKRKEKWKRQKRN